MYCLNCFQTIRKKFELDKKVGKNKGFCCVIMPSEETKLLEFNQFRKFDNTTIFIYADLVSLIKTIDKSKNYPEKSSPTKVAEHNRCGCSISTIWIFDGKENNRNRSKDYIKKFCSSLREHTMKIINFEEKKMIPLANKQQ